MATSSTTRQHPLRAGMIGGGPDGFIGDVHRRALKIDGKFLLVSGIFSRDRNKSENFASSKLGLARSRVYATPEEMARKESELPEGERIEVVIVCAPTVAHAASILPFIERGIAVVTDKPLCSNIIEAKAIADCFRASECSQHFMVTHAYSGYPLVAQARHLVVGERRLGKVLKVVVEYSQGHTLLEVEERSMEKAPASRPREAKSTLAGIGTHAAHLVSHITGCRITKVFADLGDLAEGTSRSPDDANVLLRLDGGARGVLIASQASAGESNGLRIRVYGSEGGLKWEQERPNVLEVSPVSGGPKQVFVPGGPGLSDAAKARTRLPPGHPEGLHEAFANIYSSFAADVGGGSIAMGQRREYPTLDDGLEGMAFVHACEESQERGAWVEVEGLGLRLVGY